MNKSANPWVSVVVPSYQNASLLERSVGSILRQDYENIEIIIINNGSTDNTQQVCKLLCGRDKRVKSLELPVNIGPAGARNKGVSESTGELVAFLDADDEWLPEKLSMQVKLLTTLENFDLVFTDGFLIDEETGNQQAYSRINKIFARKLELIPLVQFPNAYGLRGRVDEQLYKGNFISLSTVLLRRACFNAVGGFNRSCFGMEDLDLWIRLSNYCSFAYWFEPRAKCYWRSGSLSRLNEQRITQMISYHENCLTSIHYGGLRETVYSNLHFYYKHLILYYARRWMPINSMKVFLRSFPKRFFPSLLIYAALAFLGPIPIWVKLNLINPLLDRFSSSTSASETNGAAGI